MVWNGLGDGTKFDISFIVTHKCDQKCWFCMYECSPDSNSFLDYNIAKEFIESIDLDRVSSFGFYGGEPFVAKQEFEQVINLVRELNKPMFMISNGSWSSLINRFESLRWVSSLGVDTLFISGNHEQTEHQDREWLEYVSKRPNSMNIILKPPDDNFLPMGRLKHVEQKCTQKCKSWYGKPVRFALNPEGKVIFQSCDGVYPVVGDSSIGFNEVVTKITEVCK